MKKLLFSLVAAVLFVIGCQENSIIDAVSTESINKNQTTGENFTSGVIPLEGTLEIPNQPNSYMSINGQVDYVHELFFVDPIPPAPSILC